MIDERTEAQVLSALTAGSAASESLWGILDGARDETIFGRLEEVQHQCCLYAGTLPWQLQMTAPYLVKLPPHSFTTRLLRSAWGNSWGIFFLSDAPMESLRQHLRTFLRVADQRGRRLIFRYYDPRVMRVYLPTCRPAELRAVFGPIRCYMMESSRGDEVLRFGHRDGALQQTSQPIVQTGTVPDASDSRRAV
jgi:hypothetical protein